VGRADEVLRKRGRCWLGGHVVRGGMNGQFDNLPFGGAGLWSWYRFF
jgi:hypothetical protein